MDGFIQAHRVIFLLDGLDEMVPDHCKQLIKAFARFKNKRENQGNKIVLSGRPHGITSTARNCFGQYHAVILPLTHKQVKHFIQRWFAHIYASSSGKAGTTAKAMISEVRAHPVIDQLIENPLLLTATCILYYGGKRLPGQRAELYALFINNLLHRRFDEPEKARDCLSTLAFRMFQSQTRSADQTLMLAVLAEIYPRKADESNRDHRRRLENHFETTEPRCGLLLRDQGEITFRHLTFQEFLTALFLVETHTDYVKAIQNYWDDPRYAEVIELYVGYLSLQNKSWANKIVQDALEQPDKDPFQRRRLAARALLDIHPKRRNVDVVDLATEKLREILAFGAKPIHLADAGETLGRLGDRRDLERFIPIAGGAYPFKDGEAEIAPFEISQYPVTNQWFAKFIAAGGYKNDQYWDQKGLTWLQEKKVSDPKYWHAWRWNCPNAPVVGVSWYEANAFCHWLTLHRQDGYTYGLPTEEQWEAAAAGFEQREYPWGEWQVDRCNIAKTKIGKTSAVGIFKDGATPQGVADLAGNVLEWTAGIDEDGDVVLRGGCWGIDRDFARCADRFRNFPSYRSYFIGFRCVRTK
jgi:hypothetical protein